MARSCARASAGHDAGGSHVLAREAASGHCDQRLHPLYDRSVIAARVLVVGLVVVAACARDEARRPVVAREAPVATSVATLEARTAELRRRCAAHGRDATACRDDWACLVGPIQNSCSGRVCTHGGPRTCVSCLDLAALTGRFTAEACALRAQGRHAEAAKYFAPRSVQQSGREATNGHP